MDGIFLRVRNDFINVVVFKTTHLYLLVLLFLMRELLSVVVSHDNFDTFLMICAYFFVVYKTTTHFYIKFLCFSSGGIGENPVPLQHQRGVSP